MKNNILILIFVVIVLFLITACESISPEDEFHKYKSEDVEPIFQRSLKLAEMGGHFTTIVDQPEEAHDYIENDILPFLEETRGMAQDIQDTLVHQEIKDLNDITLKQLDLTITHFSKLAEVVELHIPPVSDASYKESEEVYVEVMEINEQIDQVIEEYNKKFEELEEKYDTQEHEKL